MYIKLVLCFCPELFTAYYAAVTAFFLLFSLFLINKYWHLLKCRTKAKAADMRRSHSNPGDGSSKALPLSALEKRIAAILSNTSVEDFPYVSNTVEISGETSEQSCSSLRTPTRSMSPVSVLEMTMDKQQIENELENDNMKQECPEEEVRSYSLDERLREPKVKLAPSTAREPRARTGRVTRVLRRNSRSIINPRQTFFSSARAFRQSSRCSPNRVEEELPDWLFDLEERRIIAEERVADEIAGLGATNRAILGCLQQLVGMFQVHLSQNS